MSVSHLWATLKVTCRQLPYMPTASSVSLPEGILWQWWFAWPSLRADRKSASPGEALGEGKESTGNIPASSPQWENPGVCPTQFLKKSQLDWVSTALSGNLLINTHFIVFFFFFFFSLSHFPAPILMKSFPNDAFSDRGLRVYFWGNLNKDEHQTQCLAP